MPFRNMLLALDGSEYSQRAAEYAFWLSSELDAELTAQHVVDPRLVDLFVAPEFGEELGVGQAVDTEEKVFKAIKRIGKVILELIEKEAEKRGLEISSQLDVGHVVDEIIREADKHDLTIIGLRGKRHKMSPTNLMTGSVAERVVYSARDPVLVAVNPLDECEQFLVAYDGSEASKGALLAAEQLAKETHKSLKALTVVAEGEKTSEAELIVEQSETCLKEFHRSDVFSIVKGPHAKTLMDQSYDTNSILVMGAYGFNKFEDMVLGNTASQVVKQTRTSVLVFRPHFVSQKRSDAGKKEATRCES